MKSEVDDTLKPYKSDLEYLNDHFDLIVHKLKVYHANFYIEVAVRLSCTSYNKIQAIAKHFIERYWWLSIQIDATIPSENGNFIYKVCNNIAITSNHIQRDAKAAEHAHQKMCEERLAVSLILAMALFDCRQLCCSLLELLDHGILDCKEW